MKELQIVSFEQAKLLKELGFDWHRNLSHKYKTKTGTKCGVTWINSDNGIWEHTIPAPTVALALKWCRDNEKYCIIGTVEYNDKTDRYLYKITRTFDFVCYSDDEYCLYEQAEKYLLDEILKILSDEK